MSEGFVSSILIGTAFRSINCLGYSNLELEKIERLYNVEIKGQFKSFLIEMGKSDGGLIGDYSIQLYRPAWRVREHLLFQVDFFNQMQEEGFYDFLNKPFVFSLISETQYYFLQTSLDNHDVVYHYDSNNELVKMTDWDLVNFMKMLVAENKGVLLPESEGDILKI
ncbi:MAG: SMI1/KNR4 family protein [Gammaproteobacteria bacterium]|nr:SMI1/KNR4 family protein [Gammaproteobacteria bacterium]